MQIFDIAKVCPFCATDGERRRLCADCASDPRRWLAEWQRHRASKRFQAVEWWDEEAGVLRNFWSFDLTADGLQSTVNDAMKAGVFHEVLENEHVTVIVFRDQPTLTLDALKPAEEESKGMLVPRPAPLEVISNVRVTRNNPVDDREIVVDSPAKLFNEDLLDRQRRVMVGWQERTRKKFESFRRERKDLNRGDALTLFAVAYPDYARLVTVHLCKRCGGFAGAVGFICKECK